MKKQTECDTREHLLATGERLCIQRGFIGMGLSELLSTAGVPKGSFYHYFRSKEAFGVAMLERYYAAYHRRMAAHFAAGGGDYRQRILAWYQETLDQFRLQGILSGCLTVKLSAEICDLSEDMRAAVDKGYGADRYPAGSGAGTGPRLRLPDLNRRAEAAGAGALCPVAGGKFTR
jgi:TetR/AcrR family transcriptional repressor of nem operon